MADTYRLGPVGVGTVTINGTTAVVGSGTDFTDYAVGDAIVVILAAGTHVERVIAAITDATNLTVTVAFAASESGRSFYVLRTAVALFGYLPRSVPYAGARVQTLAGTERVRTWAVWRAILNWPSAADYPREATTGYYLGVELPFILLEEF